MKVLAKGLFFSQLSNYYVFDVNDAKIGRVGDLLLTREGYNIHSLIIFGGFFEEKLENLRVIDDRDEIIPITELNRERVELGKLYTKSSKDNYDVTSRRWDHEEGLLLFSKLRRTPVLDSDGVKIGFITDLVFHEDGNISFIVDPTSGLQHILTLMSIRARHDLLIPEEYITQLDYESIQIRYNQKQLNDIETLPIAKIINKGVESFHISTSTIKRRFHYLILESETKDIKKHLENSRSDLEKAMKLVKTEKIVEPQDEIVQEFVTLFNEIAVTSVDPYSEMTAEDAKTHFVGRTFLTYLYGKPVGYCITSVEEKHGKQAGVIAGIGVHHKHRGKKLSKLLMKVAVDDFEAQSIDYVQTDILVKNQASLGLFHKLGFKEIGDFYLA